METFHKSSVVLFAFSIEEIEHYLFFLKCLLSFGKLNAGVSAVSKGL